MWLVLLVCFILLSLFCNSFTILMFLYSLLIIRTISASNRKDGDDGMNWLMFELLWRDFFRYVASFTDHEVNMAATAHLINGNNGGNVNKFILHLTLIESIIYLCLSIFYGNLCPLLNL